MITIWKEADSMSRTLQTRKRLAGAFIIEGLQIVAEYRVCDDSLSTRGEEGDGLPGGESGTGLGGVSPGGPGGSGLRVSGGGLGGEVVGHLIFQLEG